MTKQYFKTPDKLINGKYRVESLLKEQQFCKILVAKDVTNNTSYILKSFKRMAL